MVPKGVAFDHLSVKYLRGEIHPLKICLGCEIKSEVSKSESVVQSIVMETLDYNRYSTFGVCETCNEVKHWKNK